MKNDEHLVSGTKKHPFLWMAVLSLGGAIALARLNIFLGARVNYLDHLPLFNALTIALLVCAVVAIMISIAGLWKVRFRSVPLAVTSLASSAFLILLFLID